MAEKTPERYFTTIRKPSLWNKNTNDCDGWVDDLLMHRQRMDWWVFEAEAQGMLDYDVFDFEAGSSGDNASTMYVSYGLSLFGSDSVELSQGIFGSSSRDDLSLKVKESFLFYRW